MGVTERHGSHHARDSHARLLAQSMAERLARERGPITVGVRELRDALPEHQRLTLQRRRALRQAFEEAGLVTSPSLEEADLDATVKVRFAESRRRQRFRKWVKQPATKATRVTIALVGFVAALASLAVLLPDKSSTNLMSGDVNVLVAPLEDGRSEVSGLPLAESLSRSLRTVMPPLEHPEAPDVQIRGPEGTQAARSLHDAEELAKANGAQIVVFGDLARRHRDELALTRLLIDPRSLVGAEELGGDYALQPIDLGPVGQGPTLAGRAEFRAIVANQVRGLAALAIGLGWFDGGRWTQAAHWFERARDTWPRGERQALAELFIGNAAGKLGHYARAEDAYRRAAAELASPDRALLGLAQVELSRAQGTCDSGADVEEMHRLVSRFAAIGAKAQVGSLPGRALRLRARLGEARANLCLSLAGELRQRRAAVEAFRQVLILGSPSPNSFRAELAEARGGLGLALIQPGASHSQSTYMDARSQYLRARLLTNDPAREQVFAAMVGLIENHLHEEGGLEPDRAPVSEDSSQGEAIWGRNDPLPQGVRRQFTGFYGIGDLTCNPREPAHPRIEIGERPIAPSQLGILKPELGETINVCVQGMPDSGPISLAIFGPRGFRRTRELEVNSDFPSQTYASFWLDLRWPLGRYKAIAVQGRASTSMGFRIGKPRHQGVSTPGDARAPSPSNQVPVMVFGATPGSRALVDVYRFKGDNMTANRYVTSFAVKTNADGYGEARLPIGPDDDGSFTMVARGMGEDGGMGLYSGVRICHGHVC